MADLPENPKFDRKSGNRNTPELPPSESDFWDIEDEGEATPAPIAPEPRPARSEEKDTSSSPESDQGVYKADKNLEPEEVSRPKSSRKDAEKKETSPQSLREAASDLAGGISKPEKMAIVGVGAGLLLVVVWALSLFFSNIHTESPEARVKFPVEGQFATMEAAKTYWREPNPDSDHGVRKEARLIPAAKLTLDPASKSGALRILFMDDSEHIIGDATTVAISNGKFDNGSNEVEVYATEGFTDEGDHAAYLTEQIGKWHILVKEGPDQNSRGSEFNDLFRVTISNNRH
jgi:hypothetical protein